MTLADWLRGIGAALIGVGIICFPVGLGVSPKRDLSRFDNLADLGLFVKAGARPASLWRPLFHHSGRGQPKTVT